jgi:hypothetical protein
MAQSCAKDDNSVIPVSSLTQIDSETRAQKIEVNDLILAVEDTLNRKYARMGVESNGSALIKTSKKISLNLNSLKKKEATKELEETVVKKLKNAMFCSKFREKSVGIIDINLDTIKNNLAIISVDILTLDKAKKNGRKENKASNRSIYLTFHPGDNYNASTGAGPVSSYATHNLAVINGNGSPIYYTNIYYAYNNFNMGSWPYYQWNHSCGGFGASPCVVWPFFDPNTGLVDPYYQSLWDLDHNELNGYRSSLENTLPQFYNNGNHKVAQVDMAFDGEGDVNYTSNFFWIGWVYLGIPVSMEAPPAPTGEDSCDCDNY